MEVNTRLLNTQTVCKIDLFPFKYYQKNITHLRNFSKFIVKYFFYEEDLNFQCLDLLLLNNFYFDILV